MTDYEIYLAAAEHIAKTDYEQFSCIVVSQIAAQSSEARRWAARRKYEDMFQLREDNRFTLWDLSHKKQRSLRILLLCMAAAIEQQGGL